MKKYIAILAAVFLALPIFAQAQTITNVANAGVSLLTGVSAKATAVSDAMRLPLTTGAGALNITMSGITGSPSGCTIALAYQQNNATTPGSAVATISFTPATGVQQLVVNPIGVGTGDAYVATYACSTYPTAGLITASFSPAQVVVQANYGDPCKNPNATTSSFSISLASATTTAVAALSAGKSVYVCQFTVAGTTGGTVQLEYGTGATCGTGTTLLTGAIAVTSAQPISMGWGGSLVTAPAGNALCLVTGGTSTAVAGFISYIQQ